ncbi:DNA topoisomerase IB [Saccharothrix algeriensis]|uniref:DNA topoisomerase n=1 Tax=Saccharothrix algeriensis TaxID=173560 RepID=A0A8T8HVS8_9PSEU|nr:DNA topoisomerase IB [Saccharothrix algeriensis]MBM7813877.1 DNA topoisomerase IB [Saccharothrix algeriensis]QTR02310.1 DNA topoisomerase IB [Saccharothrix algeriensis]
MRLRRSDPSGPGWRRRRRGRGFSYTDADGAVPDAEELARIKSLVIPPAWRDVWVCPHANGHLQAVGTDSAGRRQYLYHDRWRQERDEEKHDRVLGLAPALPGFRAEVARALRGRGRGHDRVVAVALAMLDRGVFRVGGESYAEDNGTHGVATLLCSHVSVRGSTVHFCYPAKGGIQFTTSVSDADLARAVKSLLRNRSDEDRLLVDDSSRGVTAEDVNERFKQLVGEEHSVKDLRTWHATVLAAVAFAESDRPASKRGRKGVEAAVMREVSENLGNTPAVARKSYVDPRVVALYNKGKVLSDTKGDRQTVEKAVVELLGG